MKLVIQLALPHREEQNKTKHTGKKISIFKTWLRKLHFNDLTLPLQFFFYFVADLKVGLAIILPF